MKPGLLIILLCLSLILPLAGCQRGGDMEKLPDGWTSVQTPEQLAQVLAEHPVTVVDFGAPRCGWCRKLRPVLEKLSKEYDGKIHFVEVNADQAQTLAKQYGVRGIPDVRFFLNGKPAPMTGFKGYKPEGEIRPMLEALLKSKPENIK